MVCGVSLQLSMHPEMECSQSEHQREARVFAEAPGPDQLDNVARIPPLLLPTTSPRGWARVRNALLVPAHRVPPRRAHRRNRGMPAFSAAQLYIDNYVAPSRSKADDEYSKLPRLGRRDSHIMPPGRLQVISQLHPFWRTKWGYVVIVLAVLAVVGGIVGGVIGGKRTGGGGGPATTTSASAASTRTTSTATTTALVTQRAVARAYPVRREAQPATTYVTAILTPQLVVHAEATAQPP